MDVSVIIPARNAAGTLRDTLEAMSRQRTTAKFEVVVVDDGSTDTTREIASAATIGVQLVRGHGGGPAAARNNGAAAASGAILAFTDADCVPEAGWLEAGLAAMAQADLVQGRVLPPEGVHVGPFDRMISVTTEHGLYETANLFIRADLFRRLGGFESILVPRRGIELGEDAWLGWRARRAGARTVFAADALVRHAVFRRGPWGYAAERARLRFFPELARRIPELRETLFYRRWFLSSRSARFDLAAAGLLLGLLTRRSLPALLVMPYARAVLATARGSDDPVLLMAAEVAADAVGAGALAMGSIRSRSVLL